MVGVEYIKDMEEGYRDLQLRGATNIELQVIINDLVKMRLASSEEEKSPRSVKVKIKSILKKYVDCGANNICTVAKSKEDCLFCKGVTIKMDSNLYDLIQELLDISDKKKKK